MALDVASWPVREPPPGRASGSTRLSIRENGAVRNALIYVGRGDLASRSAGLSEDDRRRISDRATEIFCGMPSKDLGRACGLAAAEILDG